MLRRATAAAFAVALVLALVLGAVPSAAQEADASLSDASVSADLQRSGLRVLPWFYFRLARFGDVRLECPASVVEGDAVHCFVAEYTLVGKVFATVVVLADLYRLPTPVVLASAASPSVSADVLAGRFESPGHAVESGGFWWVSVQTVDDDVCDPQPYSLTLDVTAGIFGLSETVTVLDDGDAPAGGAAGVECAPPVEVEALDAVASEGDEALVFVLRVAGDAPQSDVRVGYELAPGSAAAGADYTPVSGTLTIPAGARHATVAVPLVDDAAAESAESFSLVLSNPAGVILAGTSATGTITDDDGSAPSVPSAVPVCGDAVLRGSVAGVFDVAQAGYSGDSHVFVDVDVTCGGAGSPVGLPTGVSVVEGPSGSLGPSGHCLAEAVTRVVVASSGAAAGCATFAVHRPIDGTDGGRSTHLVRVPDASIGEPHQMLVWIDADRDAVHDPGEPYQYVGADFVGRSVGGATLLDFGLPDEFAVGIVAGGSDRIGRAGRDSELSLRLHTATQVQRPAAEPVVVTAPLANALVGVAVAAGPSTGADVMCLSPSGTAPQCRTDADGHLTVRYRVGASPVSVLRRAQDMLTVFHDPDQDGRRALGAPSSYVAHPIAKNVNYVALGDSYSSGEAGENPPTGAYEADADSADEHCRRWNRAYPYIFAYDVIGAADPNTSIEFQTFACTGALTLNIFDPADPDGTSTVRDHLATNRPSPAAVSKYLQPARPGVPLTLIVPSRWVPRQAMSLADIQSVSEIDMITITIGGNDAGFGDVIQACVLGGLDCDRSDLSGGYDEIPTRLSALFDELKRIAPEASIFLLGYPHITPEPIEVNRTFIGYCGISGKPLHATGVEKSRLARIYHRLFLGSRGDLAISYSEAKFLWDTANSLNKMLSDTAASSGAHFVDVAGTTLNGMSLHGFAGHSPCGSHPWLNGFISQPRLLEPVSSRSFHPNQAGHQAYAVLLENYIENLVRSGTALSESGLPVNPEASE